MTEGEAPRATSVQEAAEPAAERVRRHTGYSFAIGTYEEGLAFVGIETPVYSGDSDVSMGTIQQYCSVVEDANPSYWDADFANEVWGGAIAPPAMLMVWTMQLRWKPGGVVPNPPLMGQVPLPGDMLINVSNETEYYMPVRVGDKITMTERLAALSPERRTRVGVGNFVTTVSTYRRQDEMVVAKQSNVLFRFRAVDEAELGNGISE